MGWKIYFWIYLALTLFGLFGFYGLIKTESIRFGDILSLVISVLGVIGLYSYIYKKRIFSGKIWIVLFWILVANLVLSLVISSTPLRDSVPDFLKSNLPEAKYFISKLFGYAIGLPVYLAIYRLGQKE